MNIFKPSREIIKYIIFIFIVALGIGSATEYILPGIKNILLIILCIFQIYKFVYKGERRYLQRCMHNKLFVFYVTWILYGMISFLFYYDGNPKRVELFVTLLVNISSGIILILNTKNKNDVLFFMKAMLTAMVINFGISFYELTTHLHIGEVTGYHMITSTFVGLANTNNYATFLLYCLCILIVFWFHLNSTNINVQKIWNVICLVAVITNFYCLIHTGSNTGILGFVLIVLLGYVLNIFYNFFSEKSVAIISIFFVVGYVLFFICVMTLIIEKSSINNERIIFLQNVFPYFVKTLGLGLGPGGSNIVNDGWVHNLFFEIFYEYGIIIFVLFIRVWLRLVVCNKKNLFKNQRGYVQIFVLLLPFIWISSSSALSLHFTWIFFTLLYQYIFLEGGLNAKEK